MSTCVGMTTTMIISLHKIIILSVDGVLNEMLTAVDSPRALCTFTEILYTCPDCSVSCVEVDGGLTVTLSV